MLAREDSSALYVVVDNLEDLHVQLDDVRGRWSRRSSGVTSRSLGLGEERFPFRSRLRLPG